MARKPTKQSKSQGTTKRFIGGKKRSGVRKWLRRLELAMLMLVLLPFVLTLIYKQFPPLSTLILWQRAQGVEISRINVPVSRISPHLIKAVLAAEDGQFCSHNGVDWQSLKYVAQDIYKGKRARGASTITMQLMKNLYLWHGRSYVRKGLEIGLALYGNVVLSKRRTIELYLSIAEWGPGIFGAEAAAQYHFNKSAARLTLKEAALLAAALPNPLQRLAGKPSGNHRALGRSIERRVEQSKGLFDCAL